MKSIDSVLANSIFSFSVGMGVYLWLLWMQLKNGGGGCEQGSSSTTLTPKRVPNQRKGGSSTLLQGQDQSAKVWMPGEPQSPSEEIWRTREEMMNTWTRKNNSLSFSFWLLRAWRCCEVCNPNCLNIQQLASVKQPGLHALSSSGMQKAEMGAQWDLTGHWMDVGFPPY